MKYTTAGLLAAWGIASIFMLLWLLIIWTAATHHYNPCVVDCTPVVTL